MAVFTKLTHSEIARHLQHYKIGELIDFKEIIEGIDNSNFIINTDKGRFILTIFENRINKNDLPFFMNFKLHLAKKGIHCPRPILDNQGSAIVDLKNKKSAIVTFLSGANLKAREDGYHDNIAAAHCFEVGAILAKMHLAAQDFLERRENDLGMTHWKPLFSKFSGLTKNLCYADFLDKEKLSAVDLAGEKNNLHDEIFSALDALERSWHFDLPSAATHLDFFPDNVFFDSQQKAIGVIDFYFTAHEALIYDFAIAVNAWCFDEKNIFSLEKFHALKNGYEKTRKLSAAEIDFMLVALSGAAMRFLLTRLHDMFFTPKNSLVKIKDPREYLAKLRFFLNNDKTYFF